MRIAILVFVLAAGLCAPAQAGDCEADHAIHVRQTIPYPHAANRAPLTSDQFDTASTRLIDARRGHRPYQSVRGYGCNSGGYHVYDDHFGIVRPRRSCYAGQRSSKPTYYGPARTSAVSDRSPQAAAAPPTPIVVVIQDRADEPASQAPAAEIAPTPEPMRVTIYQGEAQMPTRSGAVIVRKNGTVITVGD